ncbi:MAG: 4Fe-4S dicluster domain-containing protein [Bacteriovoracia bacterium]
MYYKSLEDVQGVESENADGSIGVESVGQTDESRREFLKLMGASFAMLSLSACTKRPVERIFPYLKKPEETTAGVSNWYASTCGECDSKCGVLVRTREGRPLKLEGNPSHPVSQGGLCARGQASLLNLYDADRLRTPIERSRGKTNQVLSWDDVDQKVIAKLKEVKQSGGSVRILTGELSSPTTEKLVREFTRSFSNASHIVYEPLAPEEVQNAQELSYGTSVLPRYRFDKANLIVTFGADFLGAWNAPVEHSKGYGKNKKIGGMKFGAKDSSPSVVKLITFESMMSLTGTNAEKRIRVRSGDELKVALALAHELILTEGKSKYAFDSEVRSALSAFSPSSVSKETGVSVEDLKAVAKDLWANRGSSIVLGGGSLAKGASGNGLEVVVNLLNSALENEGSTVDGTLSPASTKSSFSALDKLIKEMSTGKVDVLLVYQLNPVYLFESLGFAEALSNVKFVATFATHMDETADKSDLALALSHHTETWGDSQPQKGVYAVQQPTIRPLHKTRGFEESLLVWFKYFGSLSVTSWLEYIKNNWKDMVHREYGVAASFPMFWESVLRDGFFDGVSARGERSLGSSRSRSFSTRSLRVAVQAAKNTESGVTLALYAPIGEYDGRHAHNVWLQELPDPVTKVTWDNYVMISQAHAKRLGVKQDDLVRVKVGSKSLELPAFIQPGMSDDSVAIALGYGRQGAGRSGSGIGKNGFALAQASEDGLILSGIVATVEKGSGKYPLATTQRHHSVEGRKIVREATLEEFKENPAAGNEEKEHLITLWPEHEYNTYRWGMAIDLASCTGCSACVIACQAENNVPTVGKKDVMMSREMHWLRIDRYYSGQVENPQTIHQPMLCQHCENAPCETVCPVLATMHNEEGLNQQVYNRCVGTRYCANNCPYKVRRFNWFTFSDKPEPGNLVYNPDISVRTRGIMEKCTFCMQRIRDAKDRAKDFDTRVKDGDLKTACQQSCPTDAIVFGDMNDKDSRVARLKEDPRGFRVLEELNVRPSITYLTKIRNS